MLATLKDNDFFGEASLLPDDEEDDDHPSSAGDGKKAVMGKANATIVCFSYCEFLTLSRHQLNTLLRDSSQVLKLAIREVTPSHHLACKSPQSH